MDNRKRIVFITLIIVITAFFSAAQSGETVATPGLTERGRNVAVTELNGTFYIAYNDDGGWLYFGKKESGSCASPQFQRHTYVILKPTAIQTTPISIFRTM